MNPYNPYKHPFQHFAWSRRVRAFREYKQGRTELTQWEKDTLIPELLGRAKYLKEQFETVRSICDDPHLLDNIATALLKVVKHVAPESQRHVPSAFVSEVQKQADEHFVGPLAKMLQTYSAIGSAQALSKLCNDFHYMCSIIVNTEARLFGYQFTSFAQIRKHSGEVIYDATPGEVFITLTPFRGLLNEIVPVAQRTMETIENWRKQVHEETKAYFEYLARRQANAAARLRLFVEIGLIALSVALSAFFLTANDPFNLLRKNTDLQSRLSAAEATLRTRAQELEDAKREVLQLRSDRDSTAPPGRASGKAH